MGPGKESRCYVPEEYSMAWKIFLRFPLSPDSYFNQLLRPTEN